MSWNLSTGAKNALLAEAAKAQLAVTSQTIAFEDATGLGSTDRVVDAVVDLSGFDDYAYHILSILGSTSNDGDYVIQRAAAGYIELPAGSLTTEALGDQVILVVSKGGCFAEVFKNAVLDLYSGSRPASADLIETGTKLVRITKGGGTFVAGSPDNGINFGESASLGVINLATDPDTGADQILSGTGLVSGTALFGRLRANTAVEGASTTEIRMDGRVATSGVEINMSAGTGITVSVDADVTSVSISL